MFDLGGVIMDIRRDNAVAALREIGVDQANDLLGAYGQKGIFLALERGEATPEEFRAELRRYIANDVTDQQIDAAFGRFLLGIPVDRLRQLDALHADYSIYLLSNTNKIMWDSIILEEFRKDGHSIDYYFDGVIASFEVRAYKPDAEIFNIAEHRFDIKPSETLFLDDSKANVEAAKALGFNAVHVEGDRPFKDYINE